MVGAGMATVGWALSVAIYHLILNSRIHKSAIPDADANVPVQELENLPYFETLVQEALCIADEITLRLQRVSPEKAKIFI